MYLLTFLPERSKDENEFCFNEFEAKLNFGSGGASAKNVNIFI